MKQQAAQSIFFDFSFDNTCVRYVYQLIFTSLLLLTSVSFQAQNVNLAWAKRMGASSYESGRGITTDAAGNVYTVGSFGGTVDFDPNAGTTNLTSVGSNDIFVQKLDVSGNLVWAKAIGSTTVDNGENIAVDVSGNVYITGFFTGTIDFDPNVGTTNVTSAGGQDVFVLKLDASGNLVWVKTMGSGFNEFGSGLSVDAVGNVCTTGVFTDNVDFDPNAGTALLSSVGNLDIFIQKLDASGNLVWAKAMGGIFADYGEDIAMDSSGNVYAIGSFQKTVDFDPNAGTTSVTSAGGFDVFVQKLDSLGNLVWIKTMQGIDNAFGKDITIDTVGNVYTTGYFDGTVDLDPNAGIANFTSAGIYDIFVQKLNVTGNLVWAKVIGGTLYDSAYSISVDNSGNVYTTGVFEGNADFDPNVGTTNVTSAGGQDVFILKLDASGNLAWTKTIGSTFNDFGQSIAADNSGNVHTTGSFRGTTDFDTNSSSQFNLTSSGPDDVFVHKMSPCTPPAAPIGSGNQSFCPAQTVGQINVTGAGIVWYDSATGGVIVPASTAIVSGSTYYALQTVSGCESLTRLAVTMTNGSCLGTDEFYSSELLYYPNPTSGLLNISYSKEISEATVVNMLGQKVLNKKGNNLEMQLDFSSLPVATYFVKVTSEGKTKVIKVIRQ